MTPSPMPAPTPRSTYQSTCRRIVHDFTELAGLRLTPAEAQRLWNLEAFACEAMLGALVDAGFLVRSSDGSFLRNDDASRATHGHGR